MLAESLEGGGHLVVLDDHVLLLFGDTGIGVGAKFAAKLVAQLVLGVVMAEAELGFVLAELEDLALELGFTRGWHGVVVGLVEGLLHACQ